MKENDDTFEDTDTESKYEFRAEYSGSSRSMCRKCDQQISFLDLRFARLPIGHLKGWHHLDCFFSKFIVSSTTAIEHFASLKYEDQEAIEEKLLIVHSADVFSVCYSQNGCEICNRCKSKLEVNELHIFILSEDADEDDKICYHVDCFAEIAKSLKVYGSPDMVKGFLWLDENDKSWLCSKLSFSTNDVALPMVPEDVQQNFKQKLKEQSDAYHFNFKKLQRTNVGDLNKLLKHNDLYVPSKKCDKVLLLADAMTFGALLPCPQCSGHLGRDSSASYVCLDENEVLCKFKTTNCDRKPFILPSPMRANHLFRDYDYTERKLITRSILELEYVSNNEKAPSAQTESQTELENYQVALPITLANICCAGLSEANKLVVSDVVAKLGGRVVDEVDPSVLFLVTNIDEVEKDSEKIIDAKKYNIPIVSEVIVDVLKCISVGDMNAFMRSLIKNNEITANHLKSSSREENDVVAKRVRCDNYESVMKNVSGFGTTYKEKQILKVDVVDPRFEFADFTHIYKCGDELYSVVLNSDVTNKNQYYTIQLLETDECNYYWVFRSWGRIGTNLGNSASKDFSSKESAIQYFEYIYYKKTGVIFELRKVSKRIQGKSWDIHIPCDDDIGAIT